MAAEWYYTQNNQQQGPITQEALQAMAANGQIQRGDLVWCQGMANWAPAGEVPGVFVAGGAPAGGQPGWPGQAPGGFGTPGYPAVPGQYGYTPQHVGYAGGYTGESFAKQAKEALIYSIVAFFCCGIILGPIGLIKGLNAQKGMAATGNYEGKGLATAAIVCGIIATILNIIGLIVQVALRTNSF